MIPYIVLGALLLLGLIVAYRVLGGSSTTDVDPVAIMRGARDALLGLSVDLDRWRDQQTAGVANTLRRRMEVQLHELERVDPMQLDDQGAGTHALLGVAADELAWAARIGASPGYAGSEGLQRATALLLEHARDSLRQANVGRPALSGVAEVGDGRG